MEGDVRRGALRIATALLGAHLGAVRSRVDGNRDPVTSRRFDDLGREAQLVIEPVTEAHARVAREAYRVFGRGCGHPAGLNFEDCFAYALARITGERTSLRP